MSHGFGQSTIDGASRSRRGNGEHAAANRRIPSLRRVTFGAMAAVLGLLAIMPARGGDSPNTLWRAQSIYQIITDRFYDGDPDNNDADGNFDPGGHGGSSVHGGDFKGIEQKLDYIQSLGATAIWISPVVLNARGEFHGYAGLDFYRVDPHWGSLADLQHLVAAAHARGILVIDDIVVNHGGNLVDSGDPGYPEFEYPPKGYRLRFRDPARQYPPPFDLNHANPALTNLFHNNGFIEDYDDDTQVELGELSGLDDFRTESPYVRAQMARIYEYWIEQAGFDAFRIDTVKHVEMDFWRDWCPQIRSFAATHGKPNFFMFGEVLSRSEAKCGSYTGRMGGGRAGGREPFKLDSVLDYPLYFEIGPVFAAATGSPRRIAEHFDEAATNYDPAVRGQRVTFLDNHDQPRFLSLKGATTNRLELALVFLYTARGIPCLYYGTEQGFNGAKDPWDREDMFAGRFEWGPSLGDNFNMTHPLYRWVARLNNFRRLYPALQTGAQANLYSTAGRAGLLAFSRRRDDQELLIIVNTANTNQTLPGLPTMYPAGTVLQNLLAASETWTVEAGQRTPELVVPGTSAKILLAQAQVHPLDPVVTETSPAQDAKAVLTNAPVVIQFSEPMDIQSCASALSIRSAGQFQASWSAAGDRVVLVPGSDGWPAGALITVRISEDARSAVSGRTLHGGFEFRFHCAGASG